MSPYQSQTKPSKKRTTSNKEILARHLSRSWVFDFPFDLDASWDFSKGMPLRIVLSRKTTLNWPVLKLSTNWKRKSYCNRSIICDQVSNLSCRNNRPNKTTRLGRNRLPLQWGRMPSAYVEVFRFTGLVHSGLFPGIESMNMLLVYSRRSLHSLDFKFLHSWTACWCLTFLSFFIWAKDPLVYIYLYSDSYRHLIIKLILYLNEGFFSGVTFLSLTTDSPVSK